MLIRYIYTYFNLQSFNQIYIYYKIEKKNIKYKLMSTQQQLQQKLYSITKKLKQIYEQYNKLKQQIKYKDQEIKKLKIEIYRINDIHEQVQNNQIKDIRRKYQIQDSKNYGRYQDKGEILGIGGNNGYIRYHVQNGQNRENRELKYSKSLTPQQFNKSYQQPKISQMTLKSVQIPYVAKTSNTKIPSFAPLPSQVQIPITQNKNKRNYDLSEIDNKYNKDFLLQKQKQRENDKSKQKQKQVQKKQYKQKIKSFQSQTEILKQLWGERDRQIKRMDQLFQNLNKRIYGV